jgi:hypothetical protein
MLLAYFQISYSYRFLINIGSQSRCYQAPTPDGTQKEGDRSFHPTQAKAQVSAANAHFDVLVSIHMTLCHVCHVVEQIVLDTNDEYHLDMYLPWSFQRYTTTHILVL